MDSVITSLILTPEILRYGEVRLRKFLVRNCKEAFIMVQAGDIKI